MLSSELLRKQDVNHCLSDITEKDYHIRVDGFPRIKVLVLIPHTVTGDRVLDSQVEIGLRWL